MSRNTRNNRRNRQNRQRRQNAAPKFDRVVVLVDVTEKGGVVALRAMNGEWGKEIANATIEISRDDLKTACAEQNLKLTGDSAKLIGVIKALKRLQSKLPTGQKAKYSLQIVQSSKNVDGWLNNTMKRNAETIVTLHGYTARLFDHFTDIRVFKRPAGVVKRIIADGIQTSTSQGEAAAEATAAQN